LAQQHAVDEREERDVAAEAEREGESRDEGERRGASNLSQRQRDVLSKDIPVRRRRGAQDVDGDTAGGVLPFDEVVAELAPVLFAHVAGKEPKQHAIPQRQLAKRIGRSG
jgi:hypothetical protein